MNYRAQNMVVVVLLALSVSARAQNTGKNELALLLGATRTPRVEIAGVGSSIGVGTGITFQVTYARQLHQTEALTWYVEFPALAIPLQDLSSTIGATLLNYDSFFVAPSLRLKVGSNASVSPWVSVGGGYALFDQSARRRDGSHNVTRGTSTGTLQFGGGVDVHTPIRVLVPIGLRAEVRDFYRGKPAYNLNTGGGLQHNLVFSGGLVLTF